MLDGEIKDLKKYMEDMLNEWERLANGEDLTYEERRTLWDKY